MKDNNEIAELLILHGVNINEKDEDGDTPLQYATDNNSKETAKLLISYDAKLSENDKNRLSSTLLCSIS